MVGGMIELHGDTSRVLIENAPMTRGSRHLAVLVQWGWICLASAWLESAAADARPNVVLIISDDQAWTDYGFMGHPAVRTPHLDRLAGRSRVFRRGYVPSSLCCPSLASILTGRYPHQHGIVSNDPPLPPGLAGAQRWKSPEFVQGRKWMNNALESQPTLPKQLVAAGYRSFQAGKWWQGHFSRGGFTHGMTRGDEFQGGRHGDEGLKIGRHTMVPVFEFITESKKEGAPFFLWYAPMLPHDPHTPPDRLLARYLPLTPSPHVARYWAMIEWFDETVGQLLAHLDRERLTQDTLVVYVTDNGWIQHPDRPRFAPRSKQSPYDGGLRTPILLSWPGRIEPSRWDVPVSSVDIAPTVMAACGLPVHSGVAGIDLRDARALGGRNAAFGACFTHDAVVLESPVSSLRWRWGVVGEWKIIVPHAAREPGDSVQLYHVTKDPHELVNLAPVEPRRLDRLLRAVDAWWDPSRQRTAP